jgi:hypothetical protein
MLTTLLLVFTNAAGATGFGATVIPSSTSFSAATLQLEGTASSNNCDSTGTGSGGTVTTNSSNCTTGSPVPTGSLSTSTSASTTDQLQTVGKANGSSAELASASCGVAKLSDSASATDWSRTGPDTALALNGLTYQAAGPLGTQAITTDGSTGWTESTVKYTDPTPLTVLAWFKTSSNQGAILGFGNNQTTPTSDTDSDRLLWIDSTGHLVWAVYSSAVKEITSSPTYANGSWNFVAASIGSAGMQLYVNGTLAASAATPTAAQSYSGWWSFGYAGAGGGSWTDAPTSYYFNGSIAQVAVIPSQLTSAQVTALEGDNTLSTYAAGVNALSPANYWPLNDSGSVPYDGTVPGGTAAATLGDASDNTDTGTAEGGVTLGATGPTSLAAAPFPSTARPATRKLPSRMSALRASPS